MLRRTTLALLIVAALALFSFDFSLPAPRQTHASSTVSMVAAGGEHTCALVTGGAIKCWGDNTWGALGDGTTAQRTTPVSVCASGTWNGSACTGSPLTGATWITAGATFGCAVMTGGGAKCWGLNSNGQLGDGTTTTRLNPVDVCATGSGAGCAGGSALTGVLRIASGQVDTCALMSSTGVKCWGNNSNGNLGDGTITERHNPVDVCASGSGAGCAGGSALTGVGHVGTGGAHHCAFVSGGVKCWGYNFDGELGDRNAPTSASNPVDVLNNTIAAPDTTGDVGRYASLELDASGNPVVSYRDTTSQDLKVLHCNDHGCAGGDESIASPDTGGDMGFFSSLELDAAGYPVVSYFDNTNLDLKVLHCNDANCTGGDESITSPDTGGGGDVGQYPSLALDAAGYPVVSYQDFTNSDLKVLHCNDANCAGGDESITSPDTGGNVGLFSSLALDGVGYPVVSYYDGTNGDLKVLHCNEANCAGGDESITSPDTGGGNDVGRHTSLALDGAGYPVVSYYDATSADITVLHCNEANCAAGGDSITQPDFSGSGQYTSLALDAAGNPVISYQDVNNTDLKLIHCNDADCSGGGDGVTSPDTGGAVGYYTSLALDSSGDPVVSYFDETSDDLKVLHCGDANCSALLSGATWLAVGEFHNCAVVAGGEVRCWGDNFGGQLGNDTGPTDSDTPVAVCADETCATNLTGALLAGAGGGHSCAVMPGNTAKCWGFDDFGQLADGGGMVSSGTPRNVCADAACSAPISNLATGGADLGVQHGCALTTDGNVLCAGRNHKGQLGNNDAPNDSDTPVQVTGLSSKTGDGPVTVDTLTEAYYSSLVLDASGNPVVAYYDGSNFDLKLLHCGNPSCTAGNSITTPDSVGSVGAYPSLVLDGSGFPVISYQSLTSVDLKIMHCNDANCAGGDESTAIPDSTGAVGAYTSLALDGSGNPVVSYYDNTIDDLKVLHCGNSTCTAGNSIASPDTTGDVGQYSSLKLDGAGNPVVSYWDFTNADLKILHCGNSTCTAGNSISSPDTFGSTGLYGELELDSSGFPVVAYYDAFRLMPTILHCDDANCTGGGDTIIEPEPEMGTGGEKLSIALDGDGNPIVSYGSDGELRVLRCGNASCTGGNSIAAVETLGRTDLHTSLVLDTSGFPVVSYLDRAVPNDFLKVLHCNDPSCSGTNAPPPVTTFIGTGTDGDCASGTATTCAIDGPRGMYADGLTTYLADGDNCRVKKVEGGMVSTIAGLGPGSCNFNGNGTATSASLNHPNDVFLEGTDLYIADTDNCLVRKVDLSLGTPTISTVAGLTGTCTSVDGSTGVATFNKPSGVAYIGGALYVAERDGCKIRKVQGGTVSTIAGTGTCGFSGDGGPATSAQLDHPTDVALMRPGFGLLIADRDNHRVRFVHLLSGVITTVAGSGSAVDGDFSGDGGPPTSARLDGPEAVDSADGQILIADTQNDRIRIANTFTNQISTFMGAGGLLDVALTTPRSIATTGLGVVIAGEEAGGSVASSQPGDVKAGFVRACSFTNPTQCYEATIGGVDAYGDNTFTSVPTTSCSFVPGSAGSIDVGLPMLLLGAVAFRKRIRTLFLQLRSALAPRGPVLMKGGH